MPKHPIPNKNYEFDEIVTIIEQARQRAFRAVNRELIEMYWQVGKYVSEKVRSNAWGKSIVQEFAAFVQTKYAGIKGFSAQNIWRMKQFYETYADNEILCAAKDETVVEYALSRSMSPALVAEYKLHLPDKSVLENKLKELQALYNENLDLQ